MPDNTKAAIYIRVSTDTQREEGYSIDAQREMTTAHCISKGIKQYEYYIDGGFSGSNLDRPEIQRLIKDAKKQLFDCVVVFKLDRLSRSQKDTLYLIEDVLNPHNIDFISINESMDTSTPLGRLMLGILSAFAQLERENIRERTRIGMRERVKSGLWMGGGRIPFGYDYDAKQGILIPNKDAETVKKIYDLYLQGYSADKIASIVGLKYDRLAIQILKRKTNAGFICYNDVEYIGKHKPIISLETYEKTMSMMQDRSVKRFSSSNNLLTGIMYCGKCGAKMRYQKWGKTGYKIYCYSQQKSKKYLVKDPNCDNIKVWADEIENIVIKDLFEVAIKLNNMEKQELTLTALDSLHEQYDICANKIKRLYNLYALDDGDEILLETIESAKKNLKKISEQIKLEQERSMLTNKVESIKKNISHLSEIWDYMTKQEQQNVVRALVDKITITNNAIDIKYNF